MNKFAVLRYDDILCRWLFSSSFETFHQAIEHVKLLKTECRICEFKDVVKCHFVDGKIFLD